MGCQVISKDHRGRLEPPWHTWGLPKGARWGTDRAQSFQLILFKNVVFSSVSIQMTQGAQGTLALNTSEAVRYVDFCETWPLGGALGALPPM